MGKFLNVVGVVVGVVVVANLVNKGSDDNRSAAPTSLTPEQAAKRAEMLRQPDLESAFVQAVVNGQQAFNATRDEFRQGATRPARKQAICSQGIARAPVAQDWVGQVSTRTTNSDGKGVFGVTLARDVEVKTWNNDLSDIGSKTLIEPGSPMFEAMGAVQKGDWVRFSGRFFTSDADCLKETSMGLRGSMTEPEFLFRFDRVSAIPLPR